jgi:polyhydroxybutyrate depolymerase
MKKNIIRFTLVVLGASLTLLLFIAVAFMLVNRTNGSLVSSGEKRTYLLYVPESYDPSAPVPLVITFHGLVQWPAHQMQISHWNDLADEYGFIVVYPSGTGFPLHWRTLRRHNFGKTGGDTDPMRDVVFISDLIARLESEYNIDPDRIYANGLSNGGGMSFLLSCDLSDRIAAIGTVAGAFLIQWEECQPSRPVPAMVFHGTDDPIVPYWGGPYRDLEIALPPIPEWVDTLARRNECDDAPLEIPAAGETSGIRFTDCAADVVFYTIAGGGHTWPGGEPIPEWIAGHTTKDINATRTFWDFFQQHPREDNTVSKTK